jgi:hypothetical protein
MAITSQIEAAMRGFKDIILGGVPLLLRQNETALLSFICCVAAVDALAGYRYSTDKVGERFEAFIEDYFPPQYKPHAKKLYILRCRLLHNFSPAYFSLAHARPASHLQPSPIGDTILSDEAFFADLGQAAERFFAELKSDATLQDIMNARLLNSERGGAIYYE